MLTPGEWLSCTFCFWSIYIYDFPTSRFIQYILISMQVSMAFITIPQVRIINNESNNVGRINDDDSNNILLSSRCCWWIWIIAIRKTRRHCQGGNFRRDTSQVGVDLTQQHLPANLYIIVQMTGTETLPSILSTRTISLTLHFLFFCILNCSSKIEIFFFSLYFFLYGWLNFRTTSGLSWTVLW